MKYQVFLGKIGFRVENQLFPRQKTVLGRKTNFFLGKTKKPKQKIKNIFWETMRPKYKMMVFWFPLGKRWFSYPKPSWKKLVFLSKTIFFLGKTKNTIFLESGRIASQKMVFWFWGGHSVAVDYVLTSNLNELTDTFC